MLRWCKLMGQCVSTNFNFQPNVEAKWAELTKVDTWRREKLVKESGFAKFQLDIAEFGSR